jgi:glycosyltransferase involved in cell wall biosynthesis
VKVLAISSYGGVGGSELATVDMIDHRPPGVDVEALLVSGGEMERLLSVPTRVAQGYDSRPGPREAARFSRSLAPLLRASRPDVVWAVGSKATLLAAGACRATGTPLVWHKVDFAWDKQLAIPLATAATGVTAVSDALVEALGPLRERRYLGRVTPPLRIQREVVPRRDPERPVIGTLARLAPFKGIHHMLHATALLAEEFPGLRFVAAGGPAPEYADYPDRLRALARELGIEDRVELPGHVEDVAGVYERLSVFLSATYLDEHGFGLEGLGAGILEASWARVPVVVARAGGTVEALEDGVTGTLVGSPDPAALAAATAPYLRDPGLAERTGAAGREFALRRGIEPASASRRMFELLGQCAK